MVAHRALLAAFVVREPRGNRRAVARAYREIQAVPLPGTLTLARRVALAGAGLAIGVSLVAFGAPQLDRLVGARPVAPEDSPAGTAPAVPDASTALDAITGPGLVGGPAPGLATSPGDAPARAALPKLTVADLAQRLAHVEPLPSMRAAATAVLTAWGEPPLLDDDIHAPKDLEAVAWRHGLEQLQLTANGSMLRLLDLPAILVVRGEGTDQARYVALIGMDESDAVLSVDGELVGMDSEALQGVWNGQAHVLWKDFAGLGPTLQPGSRGLVVVQLQQLLRRNGGAANLQTTGMFDAATSRAVVEFQRGHRLDADGLVGPLTRIVLYAAGKDYQRPALTIARAEGSS